MGMTSEGGQAGVTGHEEGDPASTSEGEEESASDVAEVESQNVSATAAFSMDTRGLPSSPHRQQAVVCS